MYLNGERVSFLADTFHVTQKTKARLWCFGMSLVSLAVVAWDWHDLLTTNRYHPTAALFLPVCAVVLLYAGIFFPYRAAFQEMPKGVRIGSIVSLLVGLFLGLLNVYLMDPSVFRIK